MNTDQLSTLHTISFTNPCLDPDKDGDFCVYFVLETDRVEKLVTDLALFIRDIGRTLIGWSVFGHADQLTAGNPAHPALRDLAYCWDGVTCAYGVLQFSATPVLVMNIHWAPHQTSQIYGPFCPAHWYEYFTSSIFSDVEQATLPLVFAEIEVAAQYVCSTRFLLIFELFIQSFFRELCGDHALFVNAADHGGRLPF